MDGKWDDANVPPHSPSSVMVREGGPPTTSLRTMRHYYMYIVTNRPNGTLYIGVTGNLIRRISQHRDGTIEGFTKRYGLTRLVYYEVYDNPRSAIWREKRLKTWLRARKVRLIHTTNPDWKDKWDDLLNELPFD